MTRQQFLDDVCDWSDLIAFCYEMGCDYCEDVYDSEQRDEFIEDNLVDMANHCSWRSLLNILQEMEDDSGYSYYHMDYNNDFVHLDDSDFESYKNDVCDWMDNNNYWDDDEEEEEAPICCPLEDPPIEAEDFSVYELCLAGVSTCKITKESDEDIEYLLT